MCADSRFGHLPVSFVALTSCLVWIWGFWEFFSKIELFDIDEDANKGNVHIFKSVQASIWNKCFLYVAMREEEQENRDQLVYGFLHGTCVTPG